MVVYSKISVVSSKIFKVTWDFENPKESKGHQCSPGRGQPIEAVSGSSQPTDLLVDDGDLSVPGVVDDGVQVLGVGGEEGTERSPHARPPGLPVTLVVRPADASHATRHRPVQRDQVKLQHSNGRNSYYLRSFETW